ncbi:MAG: ATP synthase F1 subunit epsilon [Chloroflexi bacterium]|nr:MAG: ATP synthase F1 subunit epsilon [Chloroflexota bacterium]
MAPGIEGELTVLPMHAPLLTMIKPGIMRLVKGGADTDLAVTGGFLEVRDDQVTILADAAERAEEIDVVRAEEARRRAERALQERESEISLAQASAELQRALVRLKAAERRRRRGGPRPGQPGV